MTRPGRLFAVMAMVMGVLAASHPMVAGAPAGRGPGDATVVAVIDTGLVPYHWDFLASKMPQASNGDPADDLPLDNPPHEWLEGFPEPTDFAAYRPLELTLEERNRNAEITKLLSTDEKTWNRVEESVPEAVSYYWVPGTKVIGALDFAGSRMRGTPNSHGVGSASVAVGNIHGACPECLMVFISLGSEQQGERAIEWAMRQPWIDVISNSYGFSLLSRDRIYNGSNLDAQLAATERGQTIFFSAGNGYDNEFLVPNSTYFSSQEGPDWIITVGAVSPDGDHNYYEDIVSNSASHASYSGQGKPADIAGIGGDYPSAYTAVTVGSTGRSGFGGTSNATPTIAGLYARALHSARSLLTGASRVQAGGVIARGDEFRCGPVRPDCELGDGLLTAAELRHRLLHGAVHTPWGVSPGGAGQLPPIGEDEFMNEGHGTYFVREDGPGQTGEWLAELRRIVAPLTGNGRVLRRPEGELEWMIVDSFCRQHVWGAWRGGYYLDGKTKLPGDDPRYPTRSLLERVCPLLRPPP